MAKRKATDFNRAVADVLVGRYKARRMTQAWIARATNMNGYTLRRKLAGESPIDIEELDLICKAIGVDISDVVDEAQALLPGVKARSMSEGENTKDDLDTKRKQKARSMTTEQIETEDGTAATHDPELDSDEPEAP